MKLFERYFQKGPASEILKLHKNFQVRHDEWLYNREFSELTDANMNIKVRFAFEDPVLLDACPFLAKIGLNTDTSLPHGYVGFAYENEKNRSSLVAWVQKFPYFELIDNLDHDGVSTDESKVEVHK